MNIVGYYSTGEGTTIMCSECADREGMDIGINDPDWVPIYTFHTDAQSLSCDSMECGHQRLLVVEYD